MKRTRSLYAIALLGFILPLNSALCQDIEIKGLRLGMNKAEVETKVGPLPLKNFTIGGVPSQFSEIRPRFDDQDKLEDFTFFFDPNDFDKILRAVKAKYPKLKCKGSRVANAMGASFRQTECEMKDRLGKLEITRYIDLESSVLTLRSHKFKKFIKDAAQKGSNDI